MRRLRFWLNSIILLGPILMLGIGAVRLVREVFHYLNSNRRLAGTMSAEATRALGRVVRIGDVKITGNLWSMDAANRLDLFDVFVANGPSPADGALARARRVTVWYNLRQVLANDQPLTPLVNEIGIDSPEILLQRSAAGHWNYQDLIRPPGASSRSFTDKISVTNGTLVYADYAVPHPEGVPERPLNTRLSHLTGIVLIRSDKSYAFDLAGAGQPEYVRDFHVSGSVVPLPLNVQAHVVASQLALPSLADRLAPSDKLHVSAGHANVDAGFLYAPPIGTPARRLDTKALIAHGTLQVFDGFATGKLVYAPVEHLNGLATFTTDSILGNLSATYAGMPVRLDGAVLGVTLPPLGEGQRAAPPSAPPTVSLRGALMRADWQRISRLGFMPTLLDRLPQAVRQDLRNSRLRGDIQFKAAGPVDNPDAAMSGQFAEAAYASYSAQNLDVRALYGNRTLHATIKGHYAGGNAVLRGTVALDDAGAFEAQAQGRGIDLARIGAPIEAKITGQGQVDLAIRGQKGRTPSITARAEIDDASVNGQTLKHVYAQADTSGPDLVLRTLTAEDPKGFAVASGTVGLRSRRLNLVVDADELKFDPIAKALTPVEIGPQPRPDPANPKTNQAIASLADLKGYGYARTRLGGTIDDPVLAGKLYAFGVETGALKLDKVTLSDFTLSREELRLHGVASRYPGDIHVGGSVMKPFSRAPELKLDGRISSLDLSALLDLAAVEHKDLVVSGTLSTDLIAVRGTLASPQTPDFFTVNLQNAAVNGIPIRNAAATLRYQTDGIYVKNASASVADGLVVGSGRLPFDGPIDFTIHGAGLALQPIEDALYSPVKPDQAQPVVLGDLDFDAKVTGTIKEPVVTAPSIAGSNLVYNGFMIGSFTASASYAARHARLDTFVLNVPNHVMANQTGADAKEALVAANAFRLLTPFFPIPIPEAPKDGVVAISGLTYDIDTKQIRTEPGHPIRLESIPLERAHDLAYRLINYNNDDSRKVLDALRGVTGPVWATVALAGTLEEPRVDLTWRTAQIKAKNYEITSFTGSALIDREGVTFPSPQTPDLKFKIESPYADLVAPSDSRTRSIVVGFDTQGKRGEITTILNPDVKSGEVVPADLSVNNINLTFLQAILSETFMRRLEGSGDIGVQATGPTTSPTMVLSADVRNVRAFSALDPKAAPIVIDRIRLSPSTIKEGSIEMGRLEAIKVDSSTGTSPVAFATGKLAGFTYQPPFFLPDAQLLLTGAIPIPFIAAAVPGILRKTSRGDITLSTDIRELGKTPSVSGQVRLNVPRLELTSTATGLQDLNATLNFKNDLLSIGNFTAHTYIYGKPKIDEDEIPNPKRPVKVVRKAADVPENDPKRRGSDIQLTGSIPLGLRDDRTTGPGDGIVVRIFDANDTTPPLPASGNASRGRQPALTFNEEPLPGSTTGVLKGTVRTDPNRPLRILGSAKEPVLTGRLILYNAVVTPPAEQKPGSFALPILPSFDLALALGQNVRLKTAQLDARLSTDRDIVAHGRLLQANNDLSLEGTIQIPEGKLKLPTSQFTILPGASLHVNYPTYEGTDPVLGLNIDLKARGNVVAMSQSGVRKRYQVTVTARGPLTGDTVDPFTGRPTLALTFETNPNDLASSQQLLAEKLAGAIIGVDSLDQAGRNPGQAFTNVLSSVFTGSVLPGIFDRTAASLGFEELSIGYDPIDRLTLNISRHLFGPLYVSYYRTLTATQERYDLKLSFRFRDRYQISFDLDDQHTQKLLLEGVWKF